MGFEKANVEANATSLVSRKLMVSSVYSKKSGQLFPILGCRLFTWNIEKQIKHDHHHIYAKHHEYSVSEVILSFEFQKGNEFDLFVTFKALRSAENNDAVTELVANMEKNFEENNEIEEKFKTCFGNLTPDDILEQDYGRFLLATFPKIVFGFGSSNSFVVKCPQKFLYQRTNRRGTKYQIVKFIFSFENLGHSSTFSRASRRTAELAAHYKESTLSDFDVVPLDVDNAVMHNDALKNELEEDCVDILESRKAFGT